MIYIALYYAPLCYNKHDYVQKNKSGLTVTLTTNTQEL